MELLKTISEALQGKLPHEIAATYDPPTNSIVLEGNRFEGDISLEHDNLIIYGACYNNHGKSFSFETLPDEIIIPITQTDLIENIIKNIESMLEELTNS